jgi:thiol-disulfide isomerase/thioredoxin
VTNRPAGRTVAQLAPQARAQLAARAPARPSPRAPSDSAPAPRNQRTRRRGASRVPLSLNQIVLLATLVVLAGFGALVYWQSRSGAGASGYTPGQLNNSNNPLAAGTPAPDFSLPAAPNGHLVSLSQYRGKVVILEFFAPWCPHCRNEVSVLNSVASAFPTVQVLSVTATPYGFNYEASGGTDKTPIAMADVKQFVSTFNVSYPAMLDTPLKTGNAYGVIGYPQIFVIDRNGTIVWNNGTEGETNYTELQGVIDLAQAEPLATPTHSSATPAASPTK